MPDPAALLADAAPVPVANAQQIADDFAAQVLSILRQEARTKGNAETAATAMILMSVALRWVLDVGGPEAARVYCGDLRQALEEAITLRTFPYGRPN
jgi:hypothetical protein